MKRFKRNSKIYSAAQKRAEKSQEIRLFLGGNTMNAEQLARHLDVHIDAIIKALESLEAKGLITKAK